MAISAKVDNPERFAIQRGGQVFLGSSEGVEFVGSAHDFAQVNACTYLQVYDVKDDQISNTNQLAEDVEEKPDEGVEVDATSDAKELAEEENVELSDVKGTGKDGRVTVGDVRKHLEGSE